MMDKGVESSYCLFDWFFLQIALDGLHDGEMENTEVKCLFIPNGFLGI